MGSSSFVFGCHILPDMVLTSLSRVAARGGPLGRLAAVSPQKVALPVVRAISSTPRFAGYDWNLGVPGSRIKNPAPEKYYDPYPGMGVGWWSLMGFAFCSFFWSQWYDVSRSVNISIGIFGPNMPM